MLPPGVRWCDTFAGKARFRVAGSISAGGDIWPGKMRYPIRFSPEFFAKMLADLRGKTIPIGLRYDNPGKGSLGEYIQRHLPTSLNPAAYVGGLLIDEGYAVREVRGFIRFIDKRR